MLILIIIIDRKIQNLIKLGVNKCNFFHFMLYLDAGRALLGWEGGKTNPKVATELLKKQLEAL